MKKLDEDFATSCQQWLAVEATYLVAVSGGRDSVALLHYLHRSGYGNLVVAHVDHRLRGAESDRDCAFVRDLAAELGLPFASRAVDVRAQAKTAGLSLETAARECRYGALGEIATEFQCPRVVLAHHADDQVETVLMNLFRGTGGRGIAGMDRHSFRAGLELIRPLLEVDRAAICEFVEGERIEFREDSSNEERFALRNRVRHDLLPMIEGTFARDCRGSVLRAADLARRDEEWIAENLGALPILENGLDVTVLRKMPVAQRDRLLLKWLRFEGVPDCGCAEVERIVAILLSDENPAKVNLPGDRHVRRRAGVLFLEA